MRLKTRFKKVKEAVASGKPAQGKTTLEPSSGNAGAGMAMVAAPWVTHCGIDSAATEFMFSGSPYVWTTSSSKEEVKRLVILTDMLGYER